MPEGRRFKFNPLPAKLLPRLTATIRLSLASPRWGVGGAWYPGTMAAYESEAEEQRWNYGLEGFMGITGAGVSETKLQSE